MLRDTRRFERGMFGEGCARALVPALLLACACSSEARIRLLEPADASPDAGRPDAGRPDAGRPETGDALVLRYDFEGTGTRVSDRAGDAHAVLIGGALLDGAGGVELDGDDDYVDMPNGVVSRLRSATIVAWLTWHGGVCWQRVFDFGSNDAGEDAVGDGLTSLFATVASCPDAVLYASAELGETRYNVPGSAAMPTEALANVALAFDAERATLTLYLDGAAIGAVAAPFRLAELDDVNNWLGRSQWVQDYNLGARYEELRIYDRALSRAELVALHAHGPDAL